VSGDQQTGNSRTLWIAAAVAAAMMALCCVGIIVVSAGAGGGVPQQASDHKLRPDAPIPPQYLALVLRAGSICAQIGPAEIAAQIDLESSWNPNAYTDSGEVPAKGIAQFTDATWQTWGGDHDSDGTNSPYDPGDAIVAQGRLMCDLVAWATTQTATGKLRGDILDLAWAAYFAGRSGVLAAGGVPPAGLAHDYPQHIRARLRRYAAADATAGPVGSGGWTLPLRPGTYRVGSGFGMRWGRLHAGVDLIAATGTPIYAAATGVVLSAHCTSAYCGRPGSLGLGGCGWTVNVSHGATITTRYCHAIRLNVHVGQRCRFHAAVINSPGLVSADDQLILRSGH